MAKRPSIKEILEAAPRGARPSRLKVSPPLLSMKRPSRPLPRAKRPRRSGAKGRESRGGPPCACCAAACARPRPRLRRALGRPLSLKEKLAAARAGGASRRRGRACPRGGSRARDRGAGGGSRAGRRAEGRAGCAAAPARQADDLAREDGCGAAAQRPSRLRLDRRGCAKPAAAKAAAAPAAKAAARALPPLEKITDPKDLAEAARQAAAKKAKDLAAKAAAAAPLPLPPKPRTKAAAQASDGPTQADPRAGRRRSRTAAGPSRRGFVGRQLVSSRGSRSRGRHSPPASRP